MTSPSVDTFQAIRRDVERPFRDGWVYLDHARTLLAEVDRQAAEIARLRDVAQALEEELALLGKWSINVTADSGAALAFPVEDTP